MVAKAAWLESNPVVVERVTTTLITSVLGMWSVEAVGFDDGVWEIIVGYDPEDGRVLLEDLADAHVIYVVLAKAL